MYVKETCAACECNMASNMLPCLPAWHKHKTVGSTMNLVVTSLLDASLLHSSLLHSSKVHHCMEDRAVSLACPLCYVSLNSFWGVMSHLYLSSAFCNAAAAPAPFWSAVLPLLPCEPVPCSPCINHAIMCTVTCLDDV